ncbi:MAG TPA: hypothetical protein VGF73_05165 [Chthoniobacterales bacterium]|jgi:hypothetical protein
MSDLPVSDLLLLLQRSDGQRHWRSVDDERLCLLCHRLFTGRDVAVTDSPDGEQKIHCPTPGCPSTPTDWFFHGSVQAVTRPVSLKPPRKAEIDLDFG